MKMISELIEFERMSFEIVLEVMSVATYEQDRHLAKLGAIIYKADSDLPSAWQSYMQTKRSYHWFVVTTILNFSRPFLI